jgi:ElaB/YqjD/DUF883 family membrane-anchored ribosome-binding protein
MQDFVTETHDTRGRKPKEAFSSTHVLAASAEALNRLINQNPGVSLFISASIGVLLACLTKRR